MTQAQVTQLIQELVLATGYQCDDVELREDPLTQALVINIRSQDAHHLIGHDGEVMDSLRHLLQRIIEQRSTQTDSYLKFTLDIDNYYTKKLEVLKQKALQLAESVRTDRQPQVLEPMNAYERLVIHALLSPYADIATCSHGEGAERHIVIQYKE